ncbi:MAG: hypothetical protein JW785_05275 [Acidimicrobiia bacterium]|nr:hypothetical protein [Acidimicrobiia bacterium]
MIRRWHLVIPAAAVLLAAACSQSSGGTTAAPSSSLPTTTKPATFPTTTLLPTTTTTVAAPAPGSLEANRLLWEAQGIERYRMTIETCGDFCGSYEVWVDGETVVEVPADLDHPHRMGFGDVSWLFDVIEGAPPERLVEVEYDRQRGFPTLVRIERVAGHWATLRVETLQVTDEPLPDYQYSAEGPGAHDLRHQIRGVDAVVEGTMLTRGDYTPPEVYPDGWLIEVAVDAVWYQRAGTPALGLGSAMVIDPLVWSGLQPHTLQHREGERLILLLAASDDTTEGRPAWYARWALQRTDAGLDFLGFLADCCGFDADLPELCARWPSGEPRDAGRELALLVRWAEEFDRLGPGEPARLALRRACAADDLSPQW